MTEENNCPDAAGAVTEKVYKAKLQQLKKQEAILLKCRQNIDPAALTELTVLEDRITVIKDILSKGTLTLTEFGIFGMKGDVYAPAGFNAWRDTDGRLAIDEFSEQDAFPIEGTDLVIRGINAPEGFWQCDDPNEREETIKKNLRAILQLFNIKVIVFPERVEVQGAIPLQRLTISSQEESVGVPIISLGGG